MAPPRNKAATDEVVDVTLLGLHDRVALIQAELVDVKKAGHADVKNAQGVNLYSYDYVKEEDMMAALKPLLAKYRVALYVSPADEVTTDGNMKTARGSLTYACSHWHESHGFTEEAWTIRASASGTDKGDKAVVKAQTSVTRYLLQKGLLIETGGVDPEQENLEHERGQAAPAKAKAANGPAVINAAQRRKLMAEINEMGVPLDEAREVIAVSAGVLSTAQIPKAIFNDVLGDLHGYAANPDAGRVLIDKWRSENPDLANGLDEKLAETGGAGDGYA